MTEGLSIIGQRGQWRRRGEIIDKVETELNSISPQVKMRKTELSCCANYRGGNKANFSDFGGTPSWLHFVTIKL